MSLDPPSPCPIFKSCKKYIPKLFSAQRMIHFSWPSGVFYTLLYKHAKAKVRQTIIVSSFISTMNHIHSTLVIERFDVGRFA